MNIHGFARRWSNMRQYGIRFRHPQLLLLAPTIQFVDRNGFYSSLNDFAQRVFQNQKPRHYSRDITITMAGSRHQAILATMTVSYSGSRLQAHITAPKNTWLRGHIANHLKGAVHVDYHANPLGMDLVII
jgi:hypothetical protein